MKLKFIIIPSVILLLLYAAFAQTSYITSIVNNISTNNTLFITNPGLAGISNT